MPVSYPYVQYSGMWTRQNQMQAVAAGTWTGGQGLYSWGSNVTYGQLGLGDTTNRSSPQQVGSLTNWLNIAAGHYHTFAIKTDGSLWSWGSNVTYGQLGLGDTTNRSSPVQVGALTTWSKIDGGGQHAVAIKTDGTLWSWGVNAQGQLGLGGTSNYSSPKQVGALTTWLYIAAGYNHTIATKTDGTLWTWGWNVYGQLGLGNTSNRSSPVQVGALTTWSKIDAGHYHILATKTDGTLWSWGFNGNGELGLGTGGAGTYKSSPNQVGALTTWSKIACGGNWSLASKTDGTLWAWGGNNLGQLGQSDVSSRSSPVQVGALTTWSKIDGGGQHVVAIKTDGTLWSWGYNTSGQLGLGNITNYSSPKQVGTLTTWLNIACGRYYTLAFIPN